MKIAIVSNLYPPYARGGAEVVITRTVTELLAQGHEVVVVSTRPYGGLATLTPELEDQANERIWRFYPLNCYHLLRDHHFPAPVRFCWHLIDMFNPLNGWLVRRVIRDEKPDVVWTHNLKGIGLTIPLFLRGTGIHHVHQLHDVQLSYPSGLIIFGHERGAPWLSIGRALYTRLCRFLFGSPTLVISPSQFLQKFYAERGFFKNSQMVVLPNPAPGVSQFFRGRRQEGPLRLLFVGQLAAHKGIEFLIGALKRFEVPFELSIAGEGSLSRLVIEEAKADKRFNYVGFLARPQLIKMYGVADVLIVPSLCYENSPTVIYEALQAGLPIVASDIGGVAELIREGINGYLFTPGDAEDLLSTLRKIDQEKERLRESVEEIRSTVADYVIDRYVAKVVELFRDGVRR